MLSCHNHLLFTLNFGGALAVEPSGIFHDFHAMVTVPCSESPSADLPNRPEGMPLLLGMGGSAPAVHWLRSEDRTGTVIDACPTGH